MGKANELWDLLFKLGYIRRPKPRATLYEVIVDLRDLELAKRFIAGGHALSQRWAAGHSLSLAVKHGDMEFVRYFIENAPDAEAFIPPDGAYDLLSTAVERLSQSSEEAYAASLAIFEYLLQQSFLRPQFAAAYGECAVREQVTPAQMLIAAGLEDEEIRVGMNSFKKLSSKLDDQNFPGFAALIRAEAVDIESLKRKETAERDSNSALAEMLGSVTIAGNEPSITGAEFSAQYEALVKDVRAGNWNKALSSFDPADDRSVIEFAAENGFDELANAIMDTVSVPSDSARRAAISAAIHGHINVLHTLKAQDVKIESTSKNENSPLSEACRYGHLDIVDYLLDLGANPGAGESSGHGFTLIELAGGENRSQIIAALQAHG